MGDIDYQKVVDELDKQDFTVLGEKVEELLEIIDTLTKRIEALEKLVNFHEAIRRR